jgi:small nuclear ribonucleoprotein (snRNP)-like protein
MVDASVLVLTNDGRAVVGTLRGYDQATNLALEDCHERVFSAAQGVERVPLGLYFVRGDNVLSLSWILLFLLPCTRAPRAPLLLRLLLRIRLDTHTHAHTSSLTPPPKKKNPEKIPRKKQKPQKTTPKKQRRRGRGRRGGRRGGRLGLGARGPPAAHHALNKRKWRDGPAAVCFAQGRARV